MAGNKIGGSKAAKTIKEKYGSDYWARVGAVGGSKSRGGGFASDKKGADGLTGRERARIAGSKGGVKSKRRESTYYMFRGELQSIQYISEYLGITRGALYSRIKKHGKVE